jgi:hypothetical protein
MRPNHGISRQRRELSFPFIGIRGRLIVRRRLGLACCWRRANGKARRGKKSKCGQNLSCNPLISNETVPFTLAWGERPLGANAIRIFPGLQPLKASGGGENVAIGITPADQLHANRQTLAEAGRDRSRGATAEIGQIRHAPSNQRIDLFAVDASWTDRIAVRCILD